jgi:hypothetical protein
MVFYDPYSGYQAVFVDDAYAVPIGATFPYHCRCANTQMRKYSIESTFQIRVIEIAALVVVVVSIHAT